MSSKAATARRETQTETITIDQELTSSEEEDQEAYISMDVEAERYRAEEQHIRHQPDPERSERPDYNGEEFPMQHRTPQCGYCRRVIAMVGFSGDPNVIDGLYAAEYHCFMHHRCYDKLQERKRQEQVSREDQIVADMELAMYEKRVLEHNTYDLFNTVNFRYCLYCRGQLTDRWRGVSYPCRDPREAERLDARGCAYIHIECYNDIRRQSKYNPLPKAEPRKYAPEIDTTTFISQIEAHRRKQQEEMRLKQTVTV